MHNPHDHEPTLELLDDSADENYLQHLDLLCHLAPYSALLLVIGGPGSATSRLIGDFQQRAADTAHVMVIDAHPLMDGIGLLSAIATRLGLTASGDLETLLARLVDALRPTTILGIRPIIVVDDADSLPESVLALLASLWERSGGEHGHLTIILTGEPALRERVMRPSFAPLGSFVARVFELDAPLAHDAAQPAGQRRDDRVLHWLDSLWGVFAKPPAAETAAPSRSAPAHRKQRWIPVAVGVGALALVLLVVVRGGGVSPPSPAPVALAPEPTPITPAPTAAAIETPVPPAPVTVISEPVAPPPLAQVVPPPPAPPAPVAAALPALAEVAAKPPLPAEPAAPAERTKGAASNVVRGESWLLKQPRQDYTVQLLAAKTLPSALAYVQHHKLKNTAIFRVQRDGKVFYAVVSGVYADRKQAERVAHALPKRVLAETKPWVRSVASVQQAIRATTATAAANE